MSRFALQAICHAASNAPNLKAYRAQALEVLATITPFEAALFHAFSPRIPLETALLLGLSSEQLARSVQSWDEFASLFSTLRERADCAPVVTDAALPKRARNAFRSRIAKPLGQREMCLVHLSVRGRLISAIALFSKRENAFPHEIVTQLETLVQALAAGDALHQQLDNLPLTITPTRLVCNDQRLTPRQRELVEHVALGQTNAQIAAALGLSINAVRNHLVRIFNRLEASNRADLIRLAVLAPNHNISATLPNIPPELRYKAIK